MHPITSSHLDIMAELAAVESALTTATLERHRIEQAIRQTTCIAVLSELHDRWAAASEDLAQAQQRQRELSALLDT